MPCTKSELDLESVPPIQVGITEDYIVSTGPKSSIESGGPIEFELSASGDDYLDLSQCYLSLKCRVMNPNGNRLQTEVTSNDDVVSDGSQVSVGPVNLLLHSMFRQVDLTINDVLVSSSGDTYPYRAYLTTLMSYGEAAKGSWLARLEGWGSDEAGKYDVADNAGLKLRTDTVKNSRYFDLKGRLHIDLLMQERLVPNNCNVKITLIRSRPQFYMMSFEDTVRGACVEISEATLEARKVKLSAGEQMRLEKVLSGPGGKYPITHSVVRHFTVSSGTSSADVDSLFMGQIPNRIVLGLIENEAFSGAWGKNPYNFQHFDLNSACLVVDGKQVPSQPLQPDFSNGLYSDCYHSMIKATTAYPQDWSNGISASVYEGGCMFLGFDLTPDDAGEGVHYVTPRRLGTVKAVLRFATTLANTITIIAFAQYDNTVMIDRHRTAMFDYTA